MTYGQHRGRPAIAKLTGPRDGPWRWYFDRVGRVRALRDRAWATLSSALREQGARRARARVRAHGGGAERAAL